jgi:hypothetical protein
MLPMTAPTATATATAAQTPDQGAHLLNCSSIMVP